MNGFNRSYIPHKGDIVTIDFNPSAGSEIRKRRPALVLSNHIYSELTGLVLVCPITHAGNNKLAKLGMFIPFNNEKVNGMVNPLQFHTYDYINRRIGYISKMDNFTCNQVLTLVTDIVNAREN